MVLDSKDISSILLTGPPASAKTLFLRSLMKLKDSHFIDCSSASKSGIVDYIFESKPKYLLLDELDKLSRKDQTFLLNLMETGIVSETKYAKTRRMEIKTSVFATSNNVEKIIEPLQSRFFIVKLQSYTYNQFHEITTRLLTSNQHNVDGEIARATAETLTGLLIIFLFTSNHSYVTPYAIAQETYPDSIFASINQAQLHELVLKATQENGLTSTVAGFKVDLTNVVSAPANSELAIFTTDGALSINEAKVKSTTETFIDLVKQSQNSFSLSGVPAGVYTVDVIAQKGSARAAYEGILVLGEDLTNTQTRTIIEQQIVKENYDDDDGNNGNNGSNEKLDVSIAIGSNP